MERAFAQRVRPTGAIAWNAGPRQLVVDVVTAANVEHGVIPGVASG